LWLGYAEQIALGGWMHAKLAVVVLLLLYHHACARLLKAFERGDNRRGHVWYRWFNEAPVLMMVVAVLLVVIKPF
jgi:putative membrane protein